MNRWIYLGAAGLVVLLLYATKAVLLPFLAGLAVAYLLDPATDKLEAWKWPRGLAATVVLAVFFLTVLGVFLAVWPILEGQLVGLAASLPSALAEFRPWLNAKLEAISGQLGAAVPSDVESLLAQFSGEILAQVRQGLANLLASGKALANLLSLILITPVVAFYLLRDWDKLVARINSLLPHGQANTVRALAGKIDEVLAGFVRGQLLISLAMAVLYAAGWSLAGLENGLLLGLVAGAMAILPFIGALFGMIMALALGIAQWGFDPLHLGAVFAVYLIVQTLESAVLTPRFVGERVQLHPVWVLFAVFAGGEILGFVGVLVAVPVAAAAAVLVRHAVERYQEHNKAEALAVSDIGTTEMVPETQSEPLETYETPTDSDDRSNPPQPDA